MEWKRHDEEIFGTSDIVLKLQNPFVTINVLFMNTMNTVFTCILGIVHIELIQCNRQKLTWSETNYIQRN